MTMTLGIMESARQAAVTPRNIYYRNTAGSTNGFTTYNWSYPNLSTAPEAADRVFIFIIYAMASSGTTNQPVTSVIVNSSITATACVSSINNLNVVSMFSANVPTGTTMTVQVNFPITQTGMYISNYAAYGLSSIAPVDTSAAIGNPLTASGLNTPAGGYIIGAAQHRITTTTSTYTWSGLTAQASNYITGFNNRWATAADGFPFSQVNVPITATIAASGSVTNPTGIFAVFR